MNETIANAALLIREVSPFLASQWVSKPFHRAAVVRALFLKMRADGNDQADRVRIVLNWTLDALEA